MNGLLEIQGLRAGYGSGSVLQGVDLSLSKGDSAVVLGRNGVGKTTLIRAICGLLPPTAGRVVIGDKDLTGRPPYVIQRAGVGLVPQGRRIFSPLTVIENLQVSRSTSSAWTMERVFELFPGLYARRRNRGHQLSGGEQQMLAIGRALMGNPRLLLLDEPSDGLAPKIIELVADAIGKMRQEGLTVLLVEQNLALALSVGDRVHFVDKGRIVKSMSAIEARNDPSSLERLLGISGADSALRR
jgi:branched-chain amino acid transport system ATP-binding protein